MPCEAGPPAGNVPCAACPRVCTAQVAGASVSTASAVASGARRHRPGAATSAAAAPSPPSTITGTAHASVSVALSTASSPSTPPPIAAAPIQRQWRPRIATWPAIAPVSAAVNGASSDV
jgi:hypothetical protein